MISFVPFSTWECLSRICANYSPKISLLNEEELSVVGQQKAGGIIVAGKAVDRNLFVALVDIENNSAEILTTAKEELDIVYASISSDNKLLAFTVKKKFLSQRLTSQRKEDIFERWTYQAFVVRLGSELSGEDTWLPVTICHSYVIHIHFLEPEILSASSPKGLLILTHNHSIQLHQIEDLSGLRICSSQVLGISFDWAQWLPEQQCLMYMATPSCPERQPRALSCIQFYGMSQYSTVFNISVSAIGIREVFGNKNRESTSVSLLNKITVAYLNLDVVLWKEGTVCICHQSAPSMHHAWKVSSAKEGLEHISPIIRNRHHSSPGKVDIPTSSKGGDWVDDEALESTYTVTLLHHGCQVHSTQRSDRPETLWPLRFLPIDENQLLVISPGMPWHLLDIDPNHEPVHHIVDIDTFWPFNSKSKIDGILIPRSGKSLLLDRTTCNGFSVAVDVTKLIDLFVRNDSASNRTSIVHYLASHTQNIECIQKLLVAMQHDIWNVETTTFLEEILLGRTFARTQEKYSTCQEVLYHLPFTTLSLIDNEDGVLHVSCMYEHLSTDPLLLASSKSDSEAEPDVWQLLWHYQKSFRKRKVMTSMNPELGLQFQLNSVASSVAKLRYLSGGDSSNDESFKNACSELLSGKSPFCFSDLCTLCARTSRPNVDSPPDVREIVQQIELPFPVSDGNEDSVDLHIVTTSTWKLLRKFLSQSCPNLNGNILNNISTTYVAEQVCQSNILCSNVFKSFGVSYCEGKPDYYFIDEMPRDQLHLLSALSERLLVAVKSQAFPVPDGFSAVCTVMTFQCTNFLMFMQHVVNGALKLRKNIVSYLIKRMDDSPENIEKKLYLLGHLSKIEGEELLADPTNSLGTRYYARRKARENLTRDESFPIVLKATERDVETHYSIPEQTEMGIDAANHQFI